MRTDRFSIRLRLTVWYSAVLLLGMVAFGGGMWFALAHRLMTNVDTRLAERVEGVRTVLELESRLRDPEQLRLELWEFAREVPEGSLMRVRDSSGRDMLPVSGDLPFPADSHQDGAVYSTLAHDSREFRAVTAVVHAGGRNYEVFVANSLDSTRQVLGDVRRLLLLMIPAVLLVACLGGYWLSRKALAPVDEITRVARSITVENLSRRLTVPPTGDEIQRMSETWNEVLERLEAAVGRIRQFTADASHELRTPIAFIRATADLALRRDRPSADYRNALSEIRDEADRMTGLTESMLMLARADNTALSVNLACTSLNEIALDATAGARGAAESKGVRVESQLMSGPAVVVADAAAIRRLLLALIDNAIKYTQPGGTVVVSTAPASGGVLLSVRDTGEGIPAEALPHIFERFFRADTARSAGSGAGLGLPIAQAIAEAHGSAISVESRPGAGSCFGLVLKDRSS